MNTPGVEEGNWTWRLRRGQLDLEEHAASSRSARRMPYAGQAPAAPHGHAPCLALVLIR